MNLTAEKLERITSLIRKLKLECYTAEIPMVAVIQYPRNRRPVILAECISPALVNCEDASRIFYDVQNLLSGSFKTVPGIEKEEEYFE